MYKLEDKITEIIKKNCAIKAVKEELECNYEKLMNKEKCNDSIDYYKTEVYADLCNLLNIKLNSHRKLLNKYK